MPTTPLDLAIEAFKRIEEGRLHAAA